MKSVIITTRLIIKPIEISDINIISEILSDECVKKTYMIPDFETEDDLLGMSKKLISYSLSDSRFLRGIYRNGKLIGFVNDVGISEKSIELGYVISPSSQNNGYATEMLKATISELFTCGFESVLTGCFAENIPSMRVMEKCGMKRTGKEEDILYRGIYHRCIYYEIKYSGEG